MNIQMCASCHKYKYIITEQTCPTCINEQLTETDIQIIEYLVDKNGFGRISNIATTLDIPIEDIFETVQGDHLPSTLSKEDSLIVSREIVEGDPSIKLCDEQMIRELLSARE